MAVTMKDIAEMAQVSRPVVCAVLGGKSTCRVSAEKRKRILELVEEYGYQPNLQARSLRSGKAKICIAMGKKEMAEAALQKAIKQNMHHFQRKRFEKMLNDLQKK